MIKNVLNLFKQVEAGYKKRIFKFEVLDCKTTHIGCEFLYREGLILSFEKIYKLKKKKRYVRFIRVFLYPIYAESVKYNDQVLGSAGGGLSDHVGRKGDDKKYLLNNKGIFFKPFNFIEILSSPSRLRYISVIDLKKLLSINKMYILYTDQGLLSGSQAVENNVGGILFLLIVW